MKVVGGYKKVVTDQKGRLDVSKGEAATLSSMSGSAAAELAKSLVKKLDAESASVPHDEQQANDTMLDLYHRVATGKSYPQGSVGSVQQSHGARRRGLAQRRRDPE